MAWYYGTYSCGHEGRENIIGPGKDREWKKERAFDKICPECYKKWLEEERNKANIEAAEKSSEMELPELIGSDKQVAWANTLRMKTIERFEKQLEVFEKREAQAKEYFENIEKEGKKIDKTLDDVTYIVYGGKILTSREELSDTLDYILQTHTEAKYWIENRLCAEILDCFIKEFREYKEKNDIPEDVKQEETELKEQLTVVPETGTIKSGFVELEYKDAVLNARFVKDDDFIKIVRGLNYKWEGVWCKKITEYTGAADDRAAELGNILLANGFTVQFPDNESKEKAISADFEPENDRWVKYNTEVDRLAITWKSKNNDLYESAKKLPGARWGSGSMKVKVEFYKEVEDFAETMGFSISKLAREKIEEYKKKESGFETANVAIKIKESISDKERIEKSLKCDGTIIKDLMDA